MKKTLFKIVFNIGISFCVSAHTDIALFKSIDKSIYNSEVKDTVIADQQARLRTQLCIPLNDSLLNRDFLTRRAMFVGISSKTLVALTPDNKYRLKEIFENIILFAKKNKDIDLGLEVALLRLRFGSGVSKPRTYEQRLISLDSLATVLNRTWCLVQTKHLLGINLFDKDLVEKNVYAKGALFLFKALHILENELSDPETEYRVNNSIGFQAYKRGQFKLSKKYFKKAMYKGIGVNRVIGLNHTGLAYRGMQMLDSSNYYFRLAKHHCIVLKDSIYSTIIDGNIGENKYLEGAYKQALPLLHADADMSLRLNSLGSASNALILLSASYLALGDAAKAERFLWQAYSAAKSTNELRRMKPVYKQLTKWYSFKGNAKRTLMYSDSLQFVNDKLQESFAEFSGFEAEKLVAINASEVKIIKEWELQKQAKQFLWVTWVISVLTLLIIGLFFMNYKIRKRLKEAQLTLENKQLKEKLKNTKTALDVFVKEAHYKVLSKKSILTEADSREFFQHFNKFHLGFVVSLKELCPRVTKVEVLFSCLTLLSLSDKEMSAMLGVGTGSIRVTRSRLRRKLNINSNQDLKEILLSTCK